MGTRRLPWRCTTSSMLRAIMLPPGARRTCCYVRKAPSPSIIKRLARDASNGQRGETEHMISGRVFKHPAPVGQERIRSTTVLYKPLSVFPAVCLPPPQTCTPLTTVPWSTRPGMRATWNDNWQRSCNLNVCGSALPWKSRKASMCTPKLDLGLAARRPASPSGTLYMWNTSLCKVSRDAVLCNIRSRTMKRSHAGSPCASGSVDQWARGSKIAMRCLPVRAHVAEIHGTAKLRQRQCSGANIEDLRRGAGHLWHKIPNTPRGGPRA